jgi:membrane-bound ClpP family serine protease
MEVVIVIVLLILGIIFFLVELFLIPGISLAGIAGSAFLIGSIVYAYLKISAIAGHITLLGSIVLLGIAIWIFLRSKALDKMSLKTEIDGKVDPLKGTEINVGDIGKTLSRLAPMGKVIVNGSIVEAKTNDEFLDPDVEIVVRQVFNTNILVERKNK